MQIANAWLIITEHGSNIPVKGITPAEVYLLNRMHARHTDDTESKVQHLNLVGKGSWDNRAEKQRLLAKYTKADPQTGKPFVEEVWPGPAPAFPKTFEEIGLEVTNTSPKAGVRFPYPSKGEHEHKASEKYEVIMEA